MVANRTERATSSTSRLMPMPGLIDRPKVGAGIQGDSSEGRVFMVFSGLEGQATRLDSWEIRKSHLAPSGDVDFIGLKDSQRELAMSDIALSAGRTDGRV